MTERKSGNGFGILVTFVVLLVFWICLSGYFDAFHLGAGIISCAIIALISHDLFVREGGLETRKFVRLLRYIVWEFYQILLANLDVAYRVLHPSSFTRGRPEGSIFGAGPVDPAIIEFETTLRSDFALTTMANSITLTPGTVTILVDPPIGKFWVHAIAKAPGDALLVDQTMQTKVAEVYDEK
ncbi:MAG TPA: protein MnhE [Methanomicrobia archaeon]|nr:protein MnhE [Methanomicrobia archaeon]